MMRAVRFHGYAGLDGLRLEEVPRPEPARGEILVRVLAAGVNPFDWYAVEGWVNQYVTFSLPAILGRDVSGTVRTVGGNVRTFKPGDCVLGMSNATYAELVAVDAAVLAHLPDGCDLVDSAAIPLVSMTGDQLVRLAARARRGQSIIVTGAVGSVGRAAVHTARKLGLHVIAAVRAAHLAAAAALGVETLDIDDPAAISGLAMVDAIADTVGGETAAALFAKVKDGGCFGYASVLPDGIGAKYPSVTINRVFARPDASKIREFADDVRDGKFVLPVSRRMALREANEAHALAQRGGAGKIVLVSR